MSYQRRLYGTHIARVAITYIIGHTYQACLRCQWYQWNRTTDFASLSWLLLTGAGATTTYIFGSEAEALRAVNDYGADFLEVSGVNPNSAVMEQVNVESFMHETAQDMQSQPGSDGFHTCPTHALLRLLGRSSTTIASATSSRCVDVLEQRPFYMVCLVNQVGSIITKTMAFHKSQLDSQVIKDMVVLAALSAQDKQLRFMRDGSWHPRIAEMIADLLFLAKVEGCMREILQLGTLYVEGDTGDPNPKAHQEAYGVAIGMAMVELQCVGCGTVPAAHDEHTLCEGCGEGYYCSKACQRSHWSIHKASGCPSTQQ